MSADTEQPAAPPSRVVAIENLAARTLAGDVRDAILHRLKHEQDKRAWTDRSEDDQRRTIEQVTQTAEALVRSVVRIIAAEALPALPGTLASITVKDGIQAVLELSRTDEQRHALIDAEGKQIMLVLADPHVFFGARGEWKIKRDQPDLLLDGEAMEGGHQGDALDAAYWLHLPVAEGEPPPERWSSPKEALLHAGVDFYEPRMVASTAWTMPLWVVLARKPGDESETPEAVARIFDTQGEAASYCDDALNAQAHAAQEKQQARKKPRRRAPSDKEEALAGLMSDGEAAAVKLN